MSNTTLTINGTTHHQTFNKDENITVIAAEGLAHNNTIYTGESVNTVCLRQNAHKNNLKGSSLSRSTQFYIAGDANGNTIEGYDGRNRFYFSDHTRDNNIQAGYGHDKFTFTDDTNNNNINGGGGDDQFYFYNTANSNNVKGDSGKDLFRVKESAHSNKLSGGPGNDKAEIYGRAYNNTFDGDQGNDVILVYGKAFGNTVDGGKDDDLIASTTSGSFSGGADNDLLLTYLPCINTFPGEPLTMTGGTGRDVLIGTGLSWQAKKEEEPGDTPNLLSWSFDAGDDDDVIIPYVPLERINVSTRVEKSINNAKNNAVINAHFKPSNEVRNISYQVTTGKGRDIVALSSKPAKNVITNIKDFNWDEDQLAFDDEDMVHAVSSKLVWSQELFASPIEFDYKGHKYKLPAPQQTPKLSQIHFRTSITPDGIEIQYPDFKKEINLTYDYYLYKPKSIADNIPNFLDFDQLKISSFKSAFTKKTFAKTYTNTVDENIFVTTSRAINLIPNEKGDFQVKVKLRHDLAKLTAQFQSRDLFLTDEKAQTCLYENLETDEDLYFKTVGQSEVPKNIMAVVVQENRNGLAFTTQPKGAKFSLPAKGQSIRMLTAADFFTKGRFAMVGNSDAQNRSVTMKLGFILKGKDDNLITTPLSNPIPVKVGK